MSLSLNEISENKFYIPMYFDPNKDCSLKPIPMVGVSLEMAYPQRIIYKDLAIATAMTFILNHPKYEAVVLESVQFIKNKPQ